MLGKHKAWATQGKEERLRATKWLLGLSSVQEAKFSEFEANVPSKESILTSLFLYFQLLFNHN